MHAIYFKAFKGINISFENDILVSIVPYLKTSSIQNCKKNRGHTRENSPYTACLKVCHARSLLVTESFCNFACSSFGAAIQLLQKCTYTLLYTFYTFQIIPRKRIKIIRKKYFLDNIHNCRP